jgi:hypothetical protein
MKAKQGYTERGLVSRRSDGSVNQRANDSEAELQIEELGIQMY